MYWLQYLVLTSILAFPLTVYEELFPRTQVRAGHPNFRSLDGRSAKGLGVGVVLGGMLVMLLFGVVRRLPRTWWIWGAVVSHLFMIFTVLIAPVYIVPIFNKVTRAQRSEDCRSDFEHGAANGIPAKDVYTIDASRQTTRDERQRQRLCQHHAHHPE